MKKVIWLMLMCCMLGTTSPIFAQDNTQGDIKCDLSTLQGVIDSFINALGQLKAGTESDPVKISSTLQELANTANVQRAACDGLVFSGSKQLVIGPVTIPEGIYRAKATTIGSITVQVDPISGKCGVGVKATAAHLFNLTKGEADEGAEAVFSSKGCKALITVENIQKEWQLAFEHINTG